MRSQGSGIGGDRTLPKGRSCLSGETLCSVSKPSDDDGGEMKWPVDEKGSAELPEEETKSAVQCAVSKMHALLQSAKKRGFEIMEQEVLGGLACTSVGDGMTSWEHEGKPRPSKRGREYKDPVLGVMHRHAVLPGRRQHHEASMEQSDAQREHPCGTAIRVLQTSPDSGI